VIRPDEQRAFDDGLAAVKEQKQAGIVDYEGLVEVWKRAADNAPSIGEAFYNYGVALERSGKAEEAAKAFKQALRVKPSLRQAAESLAVFEERRGEAQRAAKIYQQILRVFPEAATARARLAELLRQRGELDSAEKLAKEALARNAETAFAYEVLMQIELSRKHPDLARLLAQKAQRLAPERSAASLGMARADMLQGREAAARTSLKALLEKHPKELQAQLMLATIARRNRDWNELAQTLAPLLVARPKWVEGYTALGVARRGLGDAPGAKEAYEKALELDQKNQEANFNLGVLYGRVLGEPKNALEYFKRFLAAAGSTLPSKHPVHALIKEAEQGIAMRAEEAKMEAEAARMEAEAAKQAAEADAKGGVEPPGEGAATSSPNEGEAGEAAEGGGAPDDLNKGPDPDEPSEG